MHQISSMIICIDVEFITEMNDEGSNLANLIGKSVSNGNPECFKK